MSLILAEICNYQGNRDNWKGKGRLTRLLESIPKSLIGKSDIIWRCIDSGSTDGSDKKIFSFPAQEKGSFQRIKGATPWESTTRTNAALLRYNLHTTNEPYFWRIENDSVFLPIEFVQSGSFIWKAIEVLERHPDIDIVHFRRWTPVDRADMPGQAKNASRIVTNLENDAFLIEQLASEYIWVDITNDVPPWFTPDSQSGYGFCPAWNPSQPIRGAVRRQDSRWFRLVAEKFATYTNHGWLGKTGSLNEIFRKENPQSEEEISSAVRKHGKAARLMIDPFICTGWRTRIHFSPLLLDFAINWACEKPYGTVLDQGGDESISTFQDIIQSYHHHNNKHIL